MRKVFGGLLAVAAMTLSGQALAADPAEQKAELRKMCDDALAVLYKAKPEAKAEVEKSAGYGCFSSFGISFFVGGAGGRGLMHDNKTKKAVYMNIGQASGGLDFGIKDYREVLLFKDAKTLQQFVDKGWEFGAPGSAAAMAEGKGAKSEGSTMDSGPITVYPLTKTGLAVGVAREGFTRWGKSWKGNGIFGGPGSPADIRYFYRTSEF